MKKVLLACLIFTIILVIVSCTTAHTHTTMGELIVVKEATCTEEGIGHILCAECGDILNTISIPLTNEHSEAVIPAVESTCKNTGLTEGKKCSACDKILLAQQETPLKAHTEEIIPAVESTCTSTGLSEGKKCSVCGDILIAQQETPVVAHTYDDKYDETCNECGFVRDAECAHRETETIKGYDSTCTSTGLTDGSKCKKCGEIILSQTVISVKAHTEVIEEAIDPTCTVMGLSEGKHCSVCKTVIVAQEVIDAKGHTEVIDKAVAPTCSETGLTQGKHCSICGEVLVAQTVINIVDHNYVDENCQYCGINVYLAKLKEDIAVLKQKCIYIEGYIASFSITISEHSSKCTSSVCMLDEKGIVSTYDSMCRNFPEFKYEIDTIDAKICKLENAEEINLQEINELAADIDEINNGRFHGGVLFDADIAALNTDIYYYLHCHITSVVIPEGVTSIEYAQFRGYSSITSITIPYTVTSINSSAFEYCSSLTNITIPNSVTSIGSSAFSDCISLTNITIPNSVTSIGIRAFHNCTSLKNINFIGTIEQWNAINKDSTWNYGTGTYTIYCTDGEIAKDGTIRYR